MNRILKLTNGETTLLQSSLKQHNKISLVKISKFFDSDEIISDDIFDVNIYFLNNDKVLTVRSLSKTDIMSEKILEEHWIDIPSNTSVIVALLEPHHGLQSKPYKIPKVRPPNWKFEFLVKEPDLPTPTSEKFLVISVFLIFVILLFLSK